MLIIMWIKDFALPLTSLLQVTMEHRPFFSDLFCIFTFLLSHHGKLLQVPTDTTPLNGIGSFALLLIEARHKHWWHDTGKLSSLGTIDTVGLPRRILGVMVYVLSQSNVS